MYILLLYIPTVQSSCVKKGERLATGPLLPRPSSSFLASISFEYLSNCFFFFLLHTQVYKERRKGESFFFVAFTLRKVDFDTFFLDRDVLFVIFIYPGELEGAARHADAPRLPSFNRTAR